MTLVISSCSIHQALFIGKSAKYRLYLTKRQAPLAVVLPPSPGADRPGEDGHEHGVRLQHAGRQVPVQGRDQVGSRVLVPAHLYSLGQHARQDWTGTEHNGSLELDR